MSNNKNASNNKSNNKKKPKKKGQHSSRQQHSSKGEQRSQKPQRQEERREQERGRAREERAQKPAEQRAPKPIEQRPPAPAPKPAEQKPPMPAKEDVEVVGTELLLDLDKGKPDRTLLKQYIMIFVGFIIGFLVAGAVYFFLISDELPLQINQGNVPAGGSAQQVQQGNNEGRTASIIPSGQWVEVTLMTGERYFGRLAVVDGLNEYLLWNVWYPPSAELDGAFARVGDEIHQPESFMLIAPPALRTWQALANGSEVIRDIFSTEGFYDMSKPSVEEILNARMSAIFLSDGTVLFGTVVKDGNQIGVNDGYFLVRTNPDAGINDPIESLDDLQLVPQNAANPGLVDTLWLGSDALVFYQVLSDDSRVVAAIDEAR